MWLPNKETIHVALVVPNMSWPLLLGENHLAATQALSDHNNKTVTFRHPAMNFNVIKQLHHIILRLQLPAFSLENHPSILHQPEPQCIELF